MIMHASRTIRRAKMLFKLLLLSFVVLSFTCYGDAGVTSTFIRTEWPSVDIPLDNEVFAVPKGYNAPQQVHITQGDYEGKAVIVSWVTPDEPGSNKVRYGLSEGNLDLTAEGSMHNYTFYTYKSGYIHQCLIDGLQGKLIMFGFINNSCMYWGHNPNLRSPKLKVRVEESVTLN